MPENICHSGTKLQLYQTVFALQLSAVKLAYNELSHHDNYVITVKIYSTCYHLLHNLTKFLEIMVIAANIAGPEEFITIKLD